MPNTTQFRWWYCKLGYFLPTAVPCVVYRTSERRKHRPTRTQRSKRIHSATQRHYDSSTHTLLVVFLNVVIRRRRALRSTYARTHLARHRHHGSDVLLPCFFSHIIGLALAVAACCAVVVVPGTTNTQSAVKSARVNKTAYIYQYG